jgi:D-alanyl-D-alanine carboxypeptidase
LSAEPADTTTTHVPTPSSSLETALLQFLGSEEGGVSALVEQDSVVEVATVGVADSEGEPISADTSFHVGSISKVFTATLVMQLVDAGLVGLDDPLSDHLPDTTVGANATIRSLLGHRSGIPSYTDNPSFFPDVLADLTRSWQPAEMLDYVSEPDGGVDNPFSYSNTNFVLLGMLVEQLHGKDLNSVLQSEIAEPLALSNTVFAGRGVVTPPALAAPFVQNYADSGVAGTPYESVSSSAFAAGALISTPTELREFLKALSAGALVSAGSLEEMTEPQSTYYGLGMELIDLVDDPVWLGHGGGIPGYRSIMALHPDTGDVVVVVTNNDVLDPAEFARKFWGDR